ncbi:hypothetical protein AEQ67_04905 [Pseudomonas sp. RIT-PI-q]|nr:hypothetical protein AEQ67_04905 [Pseudomonas sp. RIT-PI-q]
MLENPQHRATRQRYITNQLFTYKHPAKLYLSSACRMAKLIALIAEAIHVSVMRTVPMLWRAL